MTARACRWVAFAVLALAGCGGSDEPPDERVFGYIRAVDAGSRTIEFDRAAFLTGPAAQRAAEEDGAVAPGDPVPNDYYVRNEDESVRTLELAPTARLTVVRCPTSCSEGHPRELADFLRSFEARSQYWVTLSDSRVVAIDEQYVP
jgi:hypothetical protein